MPRGVYARTKSRTDGRTDGVSLVNAIDWPAMIAQLEQQRAALDQERADVDAVLEIVRRRAGPAVTVAALQEAARVPRNGKKATKQDKISAAQIATMRAMWEKGSPGMAIAKAAKVSDATVYARAKAGGWKRPKSGVAVSPAAAAPVKTPAGEQLAGSVKCTNPDCGVMTDRDPCQRCGVKLRRNKW